MACIPPIELTAKVHAAIYNKVAEAKRRGDPVTPRIRRAIALQLKRDMREEWRQWLGRADCAGQRTVSAILPQLDAWLERPWARASYRTSQVLTGHGCFGRYLRRIGREDTSRCHHCDSADDSAQHTLEHCPAWAGQRRVLRDAIGDDLALPKVVEAIVEGEDKWKAFSAYCESVMREKENAERIRRGEADPSGCQGAAAARRRRRRRGVAAHRRGWLPGGGGWDSRDGCPCP
ncbi:PREDICTED: uncharacterized protein LOC105558811 [Vollenhovia emeryi]|uniref:uncharacterized protein LOC105558811 n=1 Tax=Vollenhovia emeryi TaxID=411798 RepID=UPI0005F3C049|nr:PREDICTED: uncharacterized protein LOC105558811 [Vollenhovia emeryi]